MGKGKGATTHPALPCSHATKHRLGHACWLKLHRPLSSAGQSQPMFEITSHLSKKETSRLRKAESMVHYWDARVPFWNGKGSPADIAGQQVRDQIKAIECKARNRYDALY